MQNIVHWLRSRPPALRVAVYAAGSVAVLILAVGIGMVATILYEGTTGFLGDAEPQQNSDQEHTQTNTAEGYIVEVGNIQNGAVETFVDSNERLLRYDTLTVDDIDAMEANYLALEDYKNQVGNLSPPEEHKDQYKLLSAAVDELYTAAEIAYRVAGEPVSATAADFQEYDVLVARATANLKQSNEALGLNYSTTEGLPRVGPSGL
jgi:uncharacterized protein involved in exopolysaccharide biosynthesis